jgi:hypothetical protein
MNRSTGFDEKARGCIKVDSETRRRHNPTMTRQNIVVTVQLNGPVHIQQQINSNGILSSCCRMWTGPFNWTATTVFCRLIVGSCLCRVVECESTFLLVLPCKLCFVYCKKHVIKKTTLHFMWIFSTVLRSVMKLEYVTCVIQKLLNLF